MKLLVNMLLSGLCEVGCKFVVENPLDLIVRSGNPLDQLFGRMILYTVEK